jgi:hypothetical protein
MRRPYITPSGIVIFLVTALAFFVSILWSAFQPYPMQYNAVIQACAFVFASCVYLLLIRLFFPRRLREDGAADALGAAERRSSMGFVENVMIYTGGSAILVLIIIAAAHMQGVIRTNPVYCIRVDAKGLKAAFAFCLALYFSADFISRIGMGAAAGKERSENGRAMLRIALVLLAVSGLVCGIMANITFVWGAAPG